MTMEFVVIGLSLVAVLQALLLFRVFRVVAAVDSAEDRLAHFSGALALLTETTEEGFRSLALEVARVGKPAGPGSTREAGARKKKELFAAPAVAALAHERPRPTTGRLVRAARNGRTVPEIAADEQLSEGEVRLRLSLADASPRPRVREKKNGESHGAMRA